MGLHSLTLILRLPPGLQIVQEQYNVIRDAAEMDNRLWGAGDVQRGHQYPPTHHAHICARCE